MKNITKIIGGSLLLVAASGIQADQQILDDLIVDGSACIGQDCVNGESFGFDTIRIKENNLRIKAQDTSSTASFPTQDWQLTFNDSSNGGANKFSVDAISPSSSTPFTIEAGAPSHSLYVDDGGRLGLGTSTPVADVHVKSGNTPTVRLEQDGTSGFAAQTWDMAGNEANFFIRDASNGSKLPFRIFPGAPSNALEIRSTGVHLLGNVGLGINAPTEALHIFKSGSAIPRILFENDDAPEHFNVDVSDNGDLRLSIVGSGKQELQVSSNGDVTMSDNLIVAGTISSGGTTLNVPDYVFAPDYELMSLSDLAMYIGKENHLPNIPPAAEINEKGVNLSHFQMKLLEKVEELTLYTLQQEQTINELKAKVDQIELVNYNY